MTGTIDPDGWQGGPVLSTDFPVRKGVFNWKTYPECLEDHDVAWKIYQDRTLGSLSEGILGGMMDWFGAYRRGPVEERLNERAFKLKFPDDFANDVQSGQLPAVSWIIPSVLECEHPTFPASLGAVGIMRVIKALVANPDVWAHTVLFVTYDENGGFFDHVVPVVAEETDPGEWISAELAAHHGGRNVDGVPVEGPVGLGFRVPCLVVSPFSRGGLVATDLFDHTSLLRFCEQVFGVPVPDRDPEQQRAGLSPWRRKQVGDLTTAFDFTTAAPVSAPTLPPDQHLGRFAHVGSIADFLRAKPDETPYPVPPNEVPKQETEPPRAKVSPT
jgi:phospholipase C